MTSNVLRFVPFTYARAGEEGYKLDTKAIVQAVLAAAVTGAFVMYGTQQSLGTRLDAMDEKLDAVNQSVQEIKRDFYVPRGRQP